MTHLLSCDLVHELLLVEFSLEGLDATLMLRLEEATQSETPPGENQNLFATRTVRTYVWIVPNWTLQQSMAISTERQV